MRIPGTTTFRSNSMSANIHSSRIDEIRKSPLNKAWSPYKKDSRLLFWMKKKAETLRQKCSNEQYVAKKVTYTLTLQLLMQSRIVTKA